MTVEEICNVVALFVLVIGLLSLLFLMFFLLYKDEKDFKRLRNEELKARIKFYKDNSSDKIL